MISLKYLFEQEEESAPEENTDKKPKKTGVLGWLTKKQKRVPKYKYKRIEVNPDSGGFSSGSSSGIAAGLSKLSVPAAIATGLYFS